MIFFNFLAATVCVSISAIVVTLAAVIVVEIIRDAVNSWDAKKEVDEND